MDITRRFFLGAIPAAGAAAVVAPDSLAAEQPDPAQRSHLSPEHAATQRELNHRRSAMMEWIRARDLAMDTLPPNPAH